MYQRRRKRIPSQQDLLCPKWVESRRDSAVEFHKRHALQVKACWAAGTTAMASLYERLFERVIDFRTFRIAWNYMATHGGSAPGPNGLTYADYKQELIWDMFRYQQERIRSGKYHLGPIRNITIPKSSGHGTRILKLTNIEDRIIERSIALILQFLTECYFRPTSFAFRPDRSTWHALSQVEIIAASTNRWVWVTQDIRNAYDRVPLQRLMDLVQTYFPCDQLINLIGSILQISDRRRRHGIRQGSPLSPLLLNLYLHHHLDAPWSQTHLETPLLRYADDLLILCRSHEEAIEKHRDLDRLLLPTAMHLKHGISDAVCNLTNYGQTEWLGYLLSRNCNGELMYQLADTSYVELANDLQWSHQMPLSFLHSKQVIKGWVESRGPALAQEETKAIMLNKVRPVLQEYAVDEVIGDDDLDAMCDMAGKRWLQFRNYSSIES